MTLKYVVIIEIGIIAAAVLIPGTIFASLNDPRVPFTEEERASRVYNEDGYRIDISNRPATNLILIQTRTVDLMHIK